VTIRISEERRGERSSRAHQRLGWTATLWASGIILAAGVVFFRQPSKARDVLWAEDGGIFLQQALHSGGPELLTPYEGYVHVLPRAAAALTVAVVPPAGYALAMNALSCLAVGLIAAMVFHCVKQLDDRLHIRFAFASIPVLIGAGPLETTGNVANLHWYLLFLTPWLLMKRAGGPSDAVLLFIVASLTALTEVLSGLFVPLMVLKLRDRAYWPARIGLTLGLAYQLMTTITSPRTQNTAEPLGFGSVVTGWFVNGGGTIVYGTGPQLGAVVVNFGWATLAVASLPFLSAFAFVMWKGRPQHRLVAMVLLGGSLVLWVVIMTVNPSPIFDYAAFADETWRSVLPTRYAVITSMLVLALLPLVLSVLPRASRTTTASISAALVTLHLVTLLPADTARLEGPNWHEGVSQASNECRLREPDAGVPVPIAPVGWFADEVFIPCDRL
jgi:hypothetical protein